MSCGCIAALIVSIVGMHQITAEQALVANQRHLKAACRLVTLQFKPSLKAASSRKAVKVVCSAQKPAAAKQVSTAVAAAALATVVGFGNVDAAYADIAGLTPCSESKAYAKRQKQEIKGLTKRLKQVHTKKMGKTETLMSFPA